MGKKAVCDTDEQKIARQLAIKAERETLNRSHQQRLKELENEQKRCGLHYGRVHIDGRDLKVGVKDKDGEQVVVFGAPESFSRSAASDAVKHGAHFNEAYRPIIDSVNEAIDWFKGHYATFDRFVIYDDTGEAQFNANNVDSNYIIDQLIDFRYSLSDLV